MISSSPRGFSLITTLMVTVILALLVVGALVFTGKESASSAQHMRREAMAACLAAARNRLVAELRSGAIGLQQNEKIRFSQSTGEFTIATGHLGQDAGTGGEFGVESCNDSSGAGLGMTDLTNTTKMQGSGMTAQCWRVVATCIDNQSNAQQEVEFQFRLAL